MYQHTVLKMGHSSIFCLGLLCQVAHQLQFVLTSWPRLIVMSMTSLQKCFFVAAAQADTTQGAAMALPAAMAA